MLIASNNISITNNNTMHMNQYISTNTQQHTVNINQSIANNVNNPQLIKYYVMLV